MRDAPWTAICIELWSAGAKGWTAWLQSVSRLACDSTSRSLHTALIKQVCNPCCGSVNGVSRSWKDVGSHYPGLWALVLISGRRSFGPALVHRCRERRASSAHASRSHGPLASKVHIQSLAFSLLVWRSTAFYIYVWSI